MGRGGRTRPSRRWVQQGRGGRWDRSDRELRPFRGLPQVPSLRRLPCPLWDRRFRLLLSPRASPAALGVPGRRWGRRGQWRPWVRRCRGCRGGRGAPAGPGRRESRAHRGSRARPWDPRARGLQLLREHPDLQVCRSRRGDLVALAAPGSQRGRGLLALPSPLQGQQVLGVQQLQSLRPCREVPSAPVLQEVLFPRLFQAHRWHLWDRGIP